MYDDRLIFKYLCIHEELAGRIRGVLKRKKEPRLLLPFNVSFKILT